MNDATHTAPLPPVEWNRTQSAYPRDLCLHQRFQQQVELRSDEVAVICEDDLLTYAQLNEQADQLATALRSMGVGPEVSVGICVERSVAMIVGLLAILKAGGAYVPLSLDDPRERLAFLLTDIGIEVLLTRRRYHPMFPSSTTRFVYLDELSVPNTQSEARSGYLPTAESLACVIPTSGSTGKPKGVCITHRNIMRLVASHNVVSISPDDVFLQFAPLSFDASHFEIWGSLLNGAQLVVSPPQHISLDELGHLIEHQKITVLWLTAGIFHQMIESQVERLQGVRQLVAGGDVLSVPHVQKALQDLPGCALFNGYGPTENTTFTALARLTREIDLSRGVPIGRPIAQTQVYLLNSQLQLVPIGAPGELYTGGDGVARGYFKQPELTNEYFLPNPFHGDGSARMYRTGDMARYLADGTLEFLGRRDLQVKIRGFRVELGEVEIALLHHPAVQQALVQVRTYPQGDKRLLAYVTTRQTAIPSRKDLRQYLETQLPHYMVPSAILLLDAFPLTSNGKIDRSALPEPSAESGEDFVKPRSMVEIQIAQMFSDLLGIFPISARDDFFDLGGHSLSATRLIGRLQKRFGVSIPLSTFFLEPTVEKVAQQLYKCSELLPAYSLVGMQPKGNRPPLILVHPASGSILTYRSIVSYIKPDQPVYAFEESFLSSQWKPRTRVEDIAEDYVSMLRAFQPDGPYYLAGWSFGGLVAFEMARRLRQQGQKVAMLAMIDTYAPGPEHSPETEDDASIIIKAVMGFFFSWQNHPQGYFPPLLPVEAIRQMRKEEQY